MPVPFINIAQSAKQAALEIAGISSDFKNRALLSVADAIENKKEEIFEANKKDLLEAESLLKTGEITSAVFNRLKFDENKMRDMIAGIRDIAKLEDPINKILMARELDKDLNLFKISCPIGVIGIIFEARPDVIAQIASLAIKSSNTVILKGGKEAVNTNKTVLDIINNELDKINDFPKNVLNQVFTRDDVTEMLKCDKYINLIIPRGGNKLVKFIKENTKIPVLGHSDGICHIFVDETADFEMSKKVIIDAKTQYPSACNSVETLLIHEKFPKIAELLRTLEKAEIKLVSKPESWAFEYGDKTLAYKIVENTEEAIEHINTYGSGHTDSILTSDNNNAEKFLNKVDSAGVYWNASTRFADGFRYGFGAEVGISTNKTHARGPVGLEGLTIYKYIIKGSGQTVAEYAESMKHFTHKELIKKIL